MLFKWQWCSLCEHAMIICPKCGNNCCNGEYQCEICPLAYQYQELAIKMKKYPKTKTDILVYNWEIEK
jgi:hypothetical protein